MIDVKDLIKGEAYVISNTSRSVNARDYYHWISRHVDGNNGPGICFYNDHDYDSFSRNAHFSKDYENLNGNIYVRPASPLEVKWLDECTKISKFIPLSDIEEPEVLYDVF